MTPRTAHEATVPEDGISKLTRLLEGWTDKDGRRHKGVLERLEDQEDRWNAHDAQRLTWKNGLGLAASGGLISQALAWMQAHIK